MIFFSFFSAEPISLDSFTDDPVRVVRSLSEEPFIIDMRLDVEY